MQSFSITEAFQAGWDTFKREPWVFIGATAVTGGLLILLEIFSQNSGGILEVLFDVAYLLGTWWLGAGFIRMTLLAEAGGVPKMEMLFGEQWDVTWKYGISSWVSFILVFIGLVLLIIPGLILMAALSLATFCIVEKGMGPIQALKESRRLTKGHRLNIFGFIVLSVLANVVLGIVTIGVGLLVTVPITLLTLTHIFRKIDKTDDLGPVVPVEITEVPPVSAV